MIAREREYRRLESSLTSIYICTSLLAVAWVTLILNQVGEFTLADLEIAVIILPILLPIVGALQFFANRRETSPLRRWFSSAEPSELESREAIAVLLRFPIRIARLTAGIWMITIVAFSVSMALFARTPGIRLAQCVLSIGSAGLISYVFQYNLFRVMARRILERYKEFNTVRPNDNIGFSSIRAKYSTLYGALLTACLLASSILSYSISRRAVVQNVLDELATVMALSREELRNNPFSYEKSWRNIERGIGVRISIQDRADDVIPLKLYFDEPVRWHVLLEYSAIERQALPINLAVSEDLPGGQFLVVERNTEFLRAQLTALLLQVSIVYLCVLLMGMGLLIVFVGDFFRPVWQLVDFFNSNALSGLPVPPVHYSDDEAGLLNIQVVWLMQRMNKAVRDLKDKFWLIRDGKQSIRTTISRQQTEIAESVRENEQFYKSLGRIRKQLSPVAKNLGELGSLGGTINTTLLKINETMASVQGYCRDLTDTVTTLGGSLDRFSGSAEENSTLAGAGHQSFELSYNGIRQLEDLANTLHDSVERLSKEESTLTQLVADQVTLVRGAESISSSFAREYNDTLQEARELFRDFTSISESVGRLEDVKEQTDILGFQTTIVSSQSPSFQREFSVVADEMKDLAERTGSASSAAMRTIHGLTVQASETLEHFLQVGEDFTRIEDYIVRGQKNIDCYGELQDRWQVSALRMHDVLRFIDNDIEAAQSILEESRQKIARSRVAFDEGRRVGTEAGLILARLGELAVTVQKLVEGQQRQYAKIGETAPKVQNALFGLSRHGKKIEEISRNLEDLLHTGEELVRNSNLHLQTIVDIFNAADDIVNASEQKVRQISRFV